MVIAQFKAVIDNKKWEIIIFYLPVGIRFDGC